MVFSLVDKFLIGIGFAKCGTTQLSQLLGQHPGICSADIKETNYLYNTPKSDISFTNYLSFFDSKTRRNRIKFECSVGYIEKIEEIFDKLDILQIEYTLFCCLRHPVERSYSHFQFLKQQGKIRSSAKIWDLDDDHPVFEQSRYEQYFREIVSIGQPLPVLIDFVDIKNNPQNVVSRLFEMLNLPDFIVDVNAVTSSKTYQVRSQLLARVKSKIYHNLRERGYASILKWKLTKKLSSIFKIILFKELIDPDRVEVEKYLEKKLHSDINYYKRLSIIASNK